jgi:uncharacterized membrane protein
MKKEYCNILNQYLPNGSEDYIANLIIEHETHFNISGITTNFVTNLLKPLYF